MILGIGISMFTKINAGSQDMPDNAGGFRMFAASFAVGITNQAAILMFLFAFSWFGIDGRMESDWFAVCLSELIFGGERFPVWLPY